MVVKILSTSASFSGVSYNTDKIALNKGELMKVANFGSLQGLGRLRPEDYKQYLQMISATNKSVKKPQFHAAISAEGKSYDKRALAEIAIEWLGKMGYAEQPYLVIFHKDTANNHVHIVSTRIDRQGKKINSGFENIRAIHNLNTVMGVDEKQNIATAIEKALTYNCSTKAQFFMILENQGYKILERNEQAELIKFGKVQKRIALQEISQRLGNYQPDLNRRSQVKALFAKYAAIYETKLALFNVHLAIGPVQPTTSQYTSEFTTYLKDKFGLVLIFHTKDGKPPYGYSVIDHAGKAVYKGSEIMPLKQLLNTERKMRQPGPGDFEDNQIGHPIIPTAANTSYYQAILKAALNNYPDLMQGLHHLGLNIVHKGGHLFLEDQSARTIIPLAEILDEQDYREAEKHCFQLEEIQDEVQKQYVATPAIYISPDIDDETIHGRNRRRKKHAGTNSR
jgi:hypothetical protein